jgi:hypothetical protein
MTAATDVKIYWQLLLDKPQLVTFVATDAQMIWQKYFSERGPVQFHGRPNYIAFIQAFMMDGVEGTALIGFLGEVAMTAMDPEASGAAVLKTAGKKGAMGVMQYQRQMKDLLNAQLGNWWLTSAKAGCGAVLDAMKLGDEISPGDIHG